MEVYSFLSQLLPSFSKEDGKTNKYEAKSAIVKENQLHQRDPPPTHSFFGNKDSVSYEKGSLSQTWLFWMAWTQLATLAGQ